MSYIGWPTNVNKVILDSTSISVGEGAVVQDSLESGGLKKSRLTCANPPDKYEVKMRFDFSTKGEDNLTELERFYAWVKWTHKYGVNPFKFPAILINSNRQQGYAQENMGSETPDYEYYRITSAVNGSKSGLDQEVSMTWETYATGVILIPDNEVSVDQIEAENGCVDIFFTDVPATEPIETTIPLYINGDRETVTACEYDGALLLRYWFTEKIEPGIYTVSAGGKESFFSVD